MTAPDYSLFGDKVFRSVRHIPGQSLTYLRNPKVATKSIELSLWAAFDPESAPQNPHAAKETPFLRNHKGISASAMESLRNSEFFSVVRNPYSRFLSGYLNKVSHRGPWQHRTSVRFGVEGMPAPSLEDFLRIVKAADQRSMDPHFRPQHLNLMHGLISLDFMGHLEEMDAVRAYLLRHGMVLQSNNLNATGVGATQATSKLSAEAIDLIQDIYSADFEIYGYSKDHQEVRPVRPIKSVPRNREALDRYLTKKK